jgi:Tfp pilus assembly protein PilO
VALRVGAFRLEKLKLENLYTIYFGMTPREQTMALIAAAVVLVLIVVLPVWAAGSRIGRLEREVEQNKKQFKEVVRAIESYNRRKADLAGLQQSLAGGYDASPSTTIEGIAERFGMKDQIDSLKAKAGAPSEIFEESSVDVRLKRVRLEPLVNFLQAIENDPDKLLRIKTLSIKPRYDNRQELDVSFTVSTYRLLEGALEGL